MGTFRPISRGRLRGMRERDDHGSQIRQDYSRAEIESALAMPVAPGIQKGRMTAVCNASSWRDEPSPNGQGICSRRCTASMPTAASTRARSSTRPCSASRPWGSSFTPGNTQANFWMDARAVRQALALRLKHIREFLASKLQATLLLTGATRARVPLPQAYALRAPQTPRGTTLAAAAATSPLSASAPCRAPAAAAVAPVVVAAAELLQQVVDLVARELPRIPPTVAPSSFVIGGAGGCCEASQGAACCRGHGESNGCCAGAGACGNGAGAIGGYAVGVGGVPAVVRPWRCANCTIWGATLGGNRWLGGWRAG